MNFARRVALVAAVAFGLAACTEVTQEPMPSKITLASFASPNIPTPNDLALAGTPTFPASAQKELLQTFVDSGGWPWDQEVPITIPVSSKTWDGAKYVTDATPPTPDLASITTSTVVLLKLTAGAAATAVEYEAAVAPGKITLRKKADATGSRRWEPGARYAVFVRGGPSGVKAGGAPLSPDTAIALAIPNRDLTKRENQPLGAIPDSSVPPNGNADEIRQLEGVRNQLWNLTSWGTVPCPAPLTGSCWGPTAAPSTGAGPASALTAFPESELASFAAFTVSSQGAANPLVLIDAGSGVAPLPSDLLRTDADGTVILNPSFGPAAGGIDTLDGFSTTAMMLAQVSRPIKAATVNGANLYVYELGTTPTLVPEFRAVAGGGGNPATAKYIAQPTPIVDPTCGITGGCSVAIGLQPAIKVPVAPGVAFYMPPLKQNTKYAIVVTNRVLGVDDRPLVKPTVAKIILDFTNPFVDGSGNSLLSGVSNGTAKALSDMRSDLAPVWPVLPAGTTKADVVTAYTFKTQSIVSTSLQLAAAPYGIEQAAAQAIFEVTSAVNVSSTLPALPPGVSAVYQITFRSFDGIDKTTGAFRPTLAAELNPAAWTAGAKPNPKSDPNLAELKALVAVPSTIAGSCPTGYPADSCAPLAVVGHGLNGAKTTMLALAAELAGRGYIAIATDFPLHGDRNWCRPTPPVGVTSDCIVPGTGADGTCTPFTGGAGQGDAVPPGVCSGGSVPKTDGSHYFVSANFFRMRDAFRQNLLDQSALIAATARALPAAQGLQAVLPAGKFVDPRQAHYVGISLGSIAGTSVVATNPRITRATFDVGGGTFADIAINAPSFKASLEPLFATLIPGFTWAKVTPGDPAFDPATAARFLQLVNVAKWILDPGDPINYAAHVQLAPLPNLLANPNGSVPQTAKPAYGQISAGDTVVPNDQNELLYSLMGATRTRYDSNRPAGSDTSVPPVPYAANSVPHGIIGALPGDGSPTEYLVAGAQVRADATDWLIGITPPATRTFDLTP